MRVFLAGILTETNSFSPMPTGMTSFEEGGMTHGGGRMGLQPATTGAIRMWGDRAAGAGHSVIESLMARAQPGGQTVRATYEALRAEILADLRQAGPVDVVLLALHGAMIADGYDDCEGDLLSHCRAITGPDTVIGALLDPHCHLTPAMMASASLLVAYKEYPHVDIPERAADLYRLAMDAAHGRIRPVMRDFDCRMLAGLHTTREPMRSFVDELIEHEQMPGVLSLSIIHGFLWGDSPVVGTRMLAITDGDADLATALAGDYGRRLFDLRHKLKRPHPGIAEALDLAVAAAPGPVVLADSSDNPGGGAPGDATFLLREILARGLDNVAAGVFWDPLVVRIAREAGEGATLALRLGGKCGPMSGDPLDITATVMRIARGLTQLANGFPAALGELVWLRMGDIDLVVSDTRIQTYHPQAFTGLGIDLSTKRFICVKSSQHFHAFFAPLASEVIYVFGPGTVTPDIATIPFTKRPADFWPRLENPFG